MIGLWLLLQVATAGISTSADPEVGVETFVVVADEADGVRVGRTVSVVHRPGLDGQRELAIGITDARGRVRWTPEMAGVAALHVDDEVLDVAVAWPGPPPGTATLLALLGAAGFAGILIGVARRRRRSPG